MARDEILDQRLGLLGHLPGSMGKTAIHLLLEFILGNALSRAHLAAVTAARSPADTMGIEQAYGISALGKMQRCREAGKAASDDGDIAAMVALKWLYFGSADSGCGVPRRGIVSIQIVEMQQWIGIHGDFSLGWYRQVRPGDQVRSDTG